MNESLISKLKLAHIGNVMVLGFSAILHALSHSSVHCREGLVGFLCKKKMMWNCVARTQQRAKYTSCMSYVM